MKRFLFLVVLASCTNPDEIFPVSGLIVSSEPVDAQVVRLLRKVQRFQPSSNSQCESAEAEPLKETHADGGQYAFEVFRVEAQSLSNSGSFCFRIDTTFASGSVAWTDLSAIMTETRLAPLRDWRAEPQLDGGVLFFEPPIPFPEEFAPFLGPDGRWVFSTELDHRAQLFTHDGGLLWQVEDHFASSDGGLNYRVPMVIDEVRLEDFASTLTLSAFLAEPQPRIAYGVVSELSIPPTMIRAGQPLRLSGSRVPFSRGMPCPELGTPCPLTDGDLASVDAGLLESVTFGPIGTSLSAVVVRGMEAGPPGASVTLIQEDGGVVVASTGAPEHSAFDPSYWQLLALPDGGESRRKPAYVVIPLDSGVPILEVKIVFPEGLSRIQEISLFE